MPRYEIDAHARSSAPPSAVFALLADGATWPRWGAWTAFAATGKPDQQGLAWTPYEASRRAAMVFDNPTRVEMDPAAAARKAVSQQG